jgi:hypothetical protein
MSDAESEMRAIATRAADHEAKRQAALQRRDHQAAREHETELSRLHIRYCNLQRQVA